MQLELLFSTGNVQLDASLRGLVELLELTQPGLVHSYYLEGSFAVGQAVTGSDIDLTLLLHKRLNEAEYTRFEQIINVWCLGCPWELDFWLPNCDEIAQRPAVNWLLRSQLLYGPDYRPHVPMIGFELYQTHVVDFAVRMMAYLRGQELPLHYPLLPPDPQAEFLGYERRTVRQAGHAAEPSTKDLVGVALRIATARIALSAPVYVPDKHTCLVLYREHINDEWLELPEALDQLCRREWCYLLPTGVAQRRALRSLAEATLAFENAYLVQRQLSLLSAWRTADAAARQALEARIALVTF